MNVFYEVRRQMRAKLAQRRRVLEEQRRNENAGKSIISTSKRRPLFA